MSDRQVADDLRFMNTRLWWIAGAWSCSIAVLELFMIEPPITDNVGVPFVAVALFLFVRGLGGIETDEGERDG